MVLVDLDLKREARKVYMTPSEVIPALLRVLGTSSLHSRKAWFVWIIV